MISDVQTQMKHLKMKQEVTNRCKITSVCHEFVEEIIFDLFSYADLLQSESIRSHDNQFYPIKA